MTPEQLLVHATRFTFYPPGAEDSPDRERRYFAVHVKYRSPGKYAVVWMDECWDGSDWAYENRSSDRTDEFIEQTRFPLEQAVAIAIEQAPKVSINGRNWEQLQAFKAAARRESNGAAAP